MKTPSRKRATARPNGGDFTVAELVERMVREHIAKLPPPQLAPQQASACRSERMSFSPREAAKIAGIGYVSVYRAIKQGRLVGATRRGARRSSAARIWKSGSSLPKVGRDQPRAQPRDPAQRSLTAQHVAKLRSRSSSRWPG